MKKSIVLLSLLFLVSFLGYSQSYDDFFSGKYDNKDLSKFHITVDNTNFIKNNEYFNDFSEGYTLIGTFIKPRFVYKANEKVNFYLGMHFLKYFGTEKLTNYEPVFTVEYMPTKNLTLIFGELYGTVNHDLTDFVLFNENYITRNSENGIQLIFDNNIIKSDTWLDWKQYIFKDSPYPEILFFGTSNRFNLMNIRNQHSVNLKLAAVASHVGGQINSSDDPVETIVNTLSGLEYKYDIGNKYLQNIKLFGHFISAIDSSPTKRLSYKKGYGILSGIEISNKMLDLKLQYWYGQKFFSKFGNTMFQSIPIFLEASSQAQRPFVTANLFWSKEVFDFFKLGAGADVYYDIKNSHFDYSFGFYIKTNLNFNLQKKNK